MSHTHARHDPLVDFCCTGATIVHVDHSGTAAAQLVIRNDGARTLGNEQFRATFFHRLLRIGQLLDYCHHRSQEHR